MLINVLDCWRHNSGSAIQPAILHLMLWKSRMVSQEWMLIMLLSWKNETFHIAKEEYLMW